MNARPNSVGGGRMHSPGPWYGSCPSTTTRTSDRGVSCSAVYTWSGGGYTGPRLRAAATNACSLAQYGLASSAATSGRHDSCTVTPYAASRSSPPAPAPPTAGGMATAVPAPPLAASESTAATAASSPDFPAAPPSAARLARSSPDGTAVSGLARLPSEIADGSGFAEPKKACSDILWTARTLATRFMRPNRRKAHSIAISLIELCRPPPAGVGAAAGRGASIDCRRLGDFALADAIAVCAATNASPASRVHLRSCGSSPRCWVQRRPPLRAAGSSVRVTWGS
jgi:hypothetical protein